MLKTATNLVDASQIITPITLPGDVTLSTGNLVIGTSGKGIDFSATPGTGTSELLNDYEEGNWTPTLVPDTAFTSITYEAARKGRYTKIGNVVIAEGRIRTTAISGGSGGVRIGGLPFLTANDTYNGSCAIANAGSFADDFPMSISPVQNAQLAIIWYRTASNSADLVLQVSDLGTGANANNMRFTLVYNIT
jgi:hypothetical protein